MTWTFTNEAGDVLDISDGTTYQVARYGGIGAPNLTLLSEARPGRMGAFVRQARMGVRDLSLPIVVRGATQAVAEANAVALIAHVAGSYGRLEPRWGTLTFTTAGGATRSLRCVGSAGMMQSEGDRLGPKAIRVPLVFHAPHPNWYDPTEQSETGETGSPGSIVYDITDYPGDYGPDASSAIVEVVNAGSAETESLLWECPGPVTGPVIAHTGLGRGISFPSLVVPSGLTLQVRMGWRPDGIESFRAVLTDGSVETDVVGYMAAMSRRFHLEPGENLITVGQATEDAVTHTLSWFNEFLST